MNNLTKTYSLPLLIFLVAILCGCKKLITEGTPKNQLTTDKVFSDPSAVDAAMVNIYALFDKTIDNNYNKFLSAYSDEFTYNGQTQDYIDYAQSHVSTLNGSNSNFWKNSYFAIYQCNDMISQLKSSTELSSADVNEFSGEAEFLRAYAYYYLIGTYGKVPLITTTDVNKNKVASRADSTVVFTQILSDLQDAHQRLTPTYRGNGRVRVNRYAVAALLARVFLWQHRWTDASTSATEVLESGLYTPLPALSATFLANSNETILSFWTQNGFITDGANLVPSSGAPAFFYTSTQLNTYEVGDQRKTTWLKSTLIGSTIFYYDYKYHNRTTNTSSPEYLIALRAGEQYLIRAEARAQQNLTTGSGGAIADLNIIRQRAGLPLYNGPTDMNSVLTVIRHERQVELNTEWGNRFLDLKRWGLLNSILSPLKTAWKSTATVLPIPQTELNTDPNLTQNDGY